MNPVQGYGDFMIYDKNHVSCACNALLSMKAS